MADKRSMKAEPAAAEPATQGEAWRQPGSTMGGAGGGVTPTGKVARVTPVHRVESRRGGSELSEERWPDE